MPKIDITQKTDSLGMPKIKPRSKKSGMPEIKNASSLHHVGDSVKFTKITAERKTETSDSVEIERITEVFEEEIPEEAPEEAPNAEKPNQPKEKFDIELKEEKMQTEPKPEKKEKKKKKLGRGIKTISAISFLIFLIVTIFTLTSILPKGMLPDKYFYPCLAGFSVLSLIFAIITFRNKYKKISKIICILLEIIASTVLIFVNINADNVFNFLETIKAGGYQIEEFYVIVKADSEYQTVDDLNSKTIAIYDDPSESYLKALEKLNTINSSLTTASYSNFLDASTAFIEGKNDSLFLKAPLLEMAAESIPSFTTDNIKILDTIQIETPLNKIVADINVKDESFNILITGIDASGNIANVARSDVNMIATINPNTHQILLTSIPRDYYVQLHGTTGLKDKLTHSGLYGADMTRQTVEDLLNIKIDYYVRVNFSTVINVVNAIGGITINSDAQLYLKANDWSDKYCWIDYGKNYVDGDCALRYARERHAYSTGDLHRNQNQQEVLTAIINKVTSDKSILFNYKNLLDSLSGGFQTNIPTDKIYDLINLQLDEMPSWQIERISVEPSGSMLEYTYSISNQQLFVFLPNEESIKATTDKIRKTMHPELETKTEEGTEEITE